MDANNNASNKLEAKIKQTVFLKEEDKTDFGRILGIGSKSSQSNKNQDERRAELRTLLETRTAGAAAPGLPSPSNSTSKTCSNPSCTGPSPVILRGCKGCSTTQYCNVDCQRAHWAEHKEPCKVAKLAASLSEVSLDAESASPATASSGTLTASSSDPGGDAVSLR